MDGNLVTTAALPMAAAVLSAMITPAVLLSAAGMLVLSTSNRLSRVVDRVRALAAEVERIERTGDVDPEGITAAKQALILDQLSQLAGRAMLLRSAMTILYVAIGLLVATSILVGVVTLVQWRYDWIPVITGLAGASALLGASLLLVREARLAIGSTFQEMTFIRKLVSRWEVRKAGTWPLEDPVSGHSGVKEASHGASSPESGDRHP